MFRSQQIPAARKNAWFAAGRKKFSRTTAKAGFAMHSLVTLSQTRWFAPQPKGLSIYQISVVRQHPTANNLQAFFGADHCRPGLRRKASTMGIAASFESSEKWRNKAIQANVNCPNITGNLRFECPRVLGAISNESDLSASTKARGDYVVAAADQVAAILRQRHCR